MWYVATVQNLHATLAPTQKVSSHIACIVFGAFIEEYHVDCYVLIWGSYNIAWHMHTTINYYWWNWQVGIQCCLDNNMADIHWSEFWIIISHHQSRAFGSSSLLPAAVIQLLAHVTPSLIMRRTHLWITIISVKQLFSLSHSNTYQVKLHSKFSHPLQRLYIKPWLRFAFTLLALLTPAVGNTLLLQVQDTPGMCWFPSMFTLQGSTCSLKLAKALHLKYLLLLLIWFMLDGSM